MMADDFGYWGMANQSIIEFLIHLKDHYYNWGSRILAHFLDGMMLRTQNDFVYALINTLIFTSSLYISTRIINLSFQDINFEKLLDLSYLIFGFVVFAKKPFQTLFWRTGAANYHWMFLFLVLFLYFFRDWILLGKELKLPLKNKSSYFKLLLTLLVGSTNENVGLALLGLISWHYLLRIRHRRQPFLNKEEALVIFVLLFSTLLLILAPGNQVRSSILQPNGPLPIPDRIHWWIESLLIFLGRPDGLLLLIGFFLLAKVQKINLSQMLYQLKMKSYSQSLFILSFLLAFVFLGHNGNFYGRIGLNVSLIFVLALVSLIRDIKNSQNSNNYLKNNITSQKVLLQILLFIVFIAPPLKWIVDFNQIYSFGKLVSHREKELLIQKNLGQKALKAPILFNPYDVEDLSQNPQNWTNSSYARYLGIDSLEGIEPIPVSEEKK